MITNCDCIVPFYNEGLRPIGVVESLLQVNSISKIIVVDDGSRDDTAYKEIKSRFPKVISIRLKTNTGKTNAVREGLKHVDAEYVLLIDGDLSHIKASELDTAIQKISTNHEIDMIILPTDKGRFDPFRLYIIFGGERILRTCDLNKMYEKKFSGFQIEAMMNEYMVQNHKKTFWMRTSMRNLGKFHKWGYLGGVIKVITLFKEVAECIGWKEYILQTLFFCRKEVSNS